MEKSNVQIPLSPIVIIELLKINKEEREDSFLYFLLFTLISSSSRTLVPYLYKHDPLIISYSHVFWILPLTQINLKTKTHVVSVCGEL